MTSLLSILDAGITIVVPAAVWSLLTFGLIQLIRESVHVPRMTHRQVAGETRS
jgi:hypothetical protein